MQDVEMPSQVFLPLEHLWAGRTFKTLPLPQVDFAHVPLQLVLCCEGLNAVRVLTSVGFFQCEGSQSYGGLFDPERS